MRPHPDHLRVVTGAGAPPPGDASGGDLALTAVLLAVGLLPVLALAAGKPAGEGSAGAGTALALLSARELWRALAARIARRLRGA